jgi:hypothetical protein
MTFRDRPLQDAPPPGTNRSALESSIHVRMYDAEADSECRARTRQMRRLPRSHSLHSGPGAWEHRSIASERVDHQAVVKLSLPAQPHDGAALHRAPIPVLTQVSVGVAPRAMQWLLGVAVVPMVAGTVWLALTSEHLQRPVASACTSLT